MATIRQQKAIQKLSEIIRISKGRKRISIAEVLKKAGYSESVCRKPKLVTGSKGWQKLIDKYIPDDGLVKAHRQLFNSKSLQCFEFPLDTQDKTIKAVIKDIPGFRIIRIIKDKQKKYCYFLSPNNRDLGNALNLAYKVKGKHLPTSQRGGVDIRLEAELDRMSKILPK